MTNVTANPATNGAAARVSPNALLFINIPALVLMRLDLLLVVVAENIQNVIVKAAMSGKMGNVRKLWICIIVMELLLELELLKWAFMWL